LIKLTATITKDDGSLISIDYRNLIKINVSRTDRSSVKSPSYGVLSNGGNITLIDYDNSIKQMMLNRTVRSGMKTNIYLENTVSKSKISVGEFLTSKWDYDVDNKQVSVSLKDNLMEWQDILLSPASYDPYHEKDLSCEWLYKYIYDKTPEKYNMTSWDNLDTDTKTILSNTNFEYFILTAKNLWNAWTQLCEICQCHIYKDSSSRIVFKYNGGN
jgi:hypothetical protein